MLFVAGLLANPFEALGLEWQSIVLHLFNLVVLTVGLYFLLFKPVKRMVKERQAKVKKIEKENAELNEEVKKDEGEYRSRLVRCEEGGCGHP